ncbi:MAG: hypothetical protein LBH25_13575 [Fibromonadaceae bacterium]|jgi:hypothetical protein|nr:hypothetical protein [Fibromonadaceae bacterium]
MKRKTFSAIITTSALLFVAGLFGCSGNDTGFKYLTCQEFEKAPGECRDKLGDDHEDHNRCVTEKMCGNPDGSKECFDHYKDKCDWNGV